MPSKFRLFIRPLTQRLEVPYQRTKKRLNTIFFPLKNTAHLRFNHILIVTYGRSGSTLLQGIMNSIPGVVVKGENENVFFDFFEIYSKLYRMKHSYGKAVLPNQSWYGIGDISEKWILQHFQEFARHLLLSGVHEAHKYHCTGFKEIRYQYTGDELEAYLDFLQQLFPNAAIIFNTRNLNDVSNSAWWKEQHADEVIATLSTFETRMFQYMRGKSNCFHICYESVIAKDDQLNALFDFLGADFDPKRLDSVLNTLHSYGPTQENIKKKFNKL